MIGAKRPPLETTMNNMLIQKNFLKSTREYHLTDDSVTVRIKGVFKDDRLTISLSTLDPKPIILDSELIFQSTAEEGYNLPLYLDKPNSIEFNAFVDNLKQKILSASGTAAAPSHPEALDGNVFEEPPAFDNDEPISTTFEPIKPERLSEDLEMLKKYMPDDDNVNNFFAAVEKLIAEPDNEQAFKEMLAAYNTLGINQGAILNYSPYLKILLSDSFWA